jgi:virginiamycin B lyase
MSPRHRILPIVCSLACALLWASLAQGTALTGTVRNDAGKALPGAMVSARNIARDYIRTAVSDSAGRYRITELHSGPYEIEVQRPGFMSVVSRSVVLDDAGPTNLEFQLVLTADIHAQVSGTAWMARLPEGDMKRKFKMACAGCHQFGDVRTRRLRSREEWEATIQRMKGMSLGGYSVGHSLMPGLDDTKALAAWLAENGFGPGAGDPGVMPLPSLGGDAARVQITEYLIGEPDSVFHDSAVGNDGIGWAIDYLHGTLWKVDPATGQSKKYDIPVVGGGPHTIHPDRDNILWITMQLVDEVVSFDPRSETFRVYDGFTRDALVHSFAIDSMGYIAYDHEGNLWVSGSGNNTVASLNPRTGAVKEYPLPLTGALPPTRVAAYGMAMDSEKNVWYTKLNEGVFGRIDARTKEITQYRMPENYSGPRRLSVDSRDRLWIPEYSTGRITRFDPKTGQFESYDLPEAGDYPYALRVDGKHDIVWICGTGSDSVYRFDPETKRFTQFRMPSSLAFTRQLSVDHQTGDIWTSYSNIPNAWGRHRKGVLVRIELR